MTRRTKKRLIAASVIIICSVLLALLVSLGIGVVQKILHPVDYIQYVERYSNEYNVPEYIILAVINVESEFNKDAISSAGAIGLMQMLPDTFTWLSSFEHLNENLTVNDIYDPEVSIRYGTYYLRYLFEKFHNWDTVFAAYNGGEGNVAKWLNDPAYSNGDGTLKSIPFPETARYVQKINDNIKYYKSTYYEE